MGASGYMAGVRKQKRLLFYLFISLTLILGVFQNRSVVFAAIGAPVTPPSIAKPLPKPLPTAKPTPVATNKSGSASIPAQPASTPAKPASTQKALPVQAKPISVPTAPKLSAAAVVLMDATNGRVLYALNPHTKRAPASLTKIATAIVAVQQGKMNSVARVSSNAASEPAMRLGLTTGDRIRLSKLLDAALMGSNNDAATAIAEHIAGSEYAFAQRMNAVAKKIGANESNFRNPHGLDATGHYSTAYDLALLSRYALNISTLARVFRQQGVSLTWDGGRSRVENINSFLWRYSGAIGLKTGYTQDAGYSVSAAAKRGTHSLVAVLLGCPTSDARWNDAQHLMDYGFKYYNTLAAAAAARPAGRVYTVKGGDTLYGIAGRLGVKVTVLLQANPKLAAHPDQLLPGQKLVVP